jgi:NAD(P)H dehydrogenase (quinone)
MIIAGIPFTEAELGTTLSGGTPYGASHVAGSAGTPHLSDAEGRLAFAQGRRLAILSEKLGRP